MDINSNNPIGEPDMSDIKLHERITRLETKVEAWEDKLGGMFKTIDELPSKIGWTIVKLLIIPFLLIWLANSNKKITIVEVNEKGEVLNGFQKTKKSYSK